MATVKYHRTNGSTESAKPINKNKVAEEAKLTSAQKTEYQARINKLSESDLAEMISYADQQLQGRREKRRREQQAAQQKQIDEQISQLTNKAKALAPRLRSIKQQLSKGLRSTNSQITVTFRVTTTPIISTGSPFKSHDTANRLASWLVNNINTDTDSVIQYMYRLYNTEVQVSKKGLTKAQHGMLQTEFTNKLKNACNDALRLVPKQKQILTEVATKLLELNRLVRKEVGATILNTTQYRQIVIEKLASLIFSLLS